MMIVAGIIMLSSPPCWDMVFIRHLVMGSKGYPPWDAGAFGVVYKGFKRDGEAKPTQPTSTMHELSWLPSGEHTKSYGKLPFRVDFPIKNGDFPWQNVSSPEGNQGNHSQMAARFSLWNILIYPDYFIVKTMCILCTQKHTALCPIFWAMCFHLCAVLSPYVCCRSWMFQLVWNWLDETFLVPFVGWSHQSGRSGFGCGVVFQLPVAEILCRTPQTECRKASSSSISPLFQTQISQFSAYVYWFWWF